MSLYLTSDESFIPFRRPSVDIRGQTVAPDVLVALLDRPGEMHALTIKNQHFYTGLRHYITETQGLNAWEQFQAIAYAPREEICDRDWIDAISGFLANNPVFLTKFKESVGYDDDDDDDDDDNFGSSSSSSSSSSKLDTSPLSSPGNKHHHHHVIQQLQPVMEENIPKQQQQLHNQKHHQHQYSPRLRHPHARLLALRDYPDIQSRLQFMCPAYFRKARHLMSLVPSDKRCNAARRNSILEEEPVAAATTESDEMVHRFDVDCYDEGGDASPFDHFKNVVSATRWEQPDDDAWIDAIVETLDGWPELLDGLEEIATSLHDADTDDDDDNDNDNHHHRGPAHRRESTSEVSLS